VWFAGVLDAAGRFTYRAKLYRPQIKVVRQSRASAYLFMDITKFGTVLSAGGGGTWMWTCENRNEIELLLPQVIPHMRIQRQHAKLLADLASLIKSRGGLSGKVSTENMDLRKEICAKLTALNEGGA
jgi:hypothetical protein